MRVDQDAEQALHPEPLDEPQQILLKDYSPPPFLIDTVEAGAFASFNDSDNQGTAYEFGGFVEGDADIGSEIVHFAGVELSYRYLDLEGVDIDDAIVFTMFAGAKYFLTENIALRASLNASVASEDVYADDNDVQDTDFNVKLGMAFYIP